MPNIFFTADTHFGHGRIIQYCNRPFKTEGQPDPQAMDEAIIERLNSVLKAGDLLYHLGDVAWSTFDVQKYFLDKLNTKEVFLVLGNHDPENKMRKYPFRWVKEIAKLGIESRGIVLCHYAMRTWRGKGSGNYQLYGHSHGKLPGLGRQMDVGVDTNNFYPYEWSEIRQRMEALTFDKYEEVQ